MAPAAPGRGGGRQRQPAPLGRPRADVEQPGPAQAPGHGVRLAKTGNVIVMTKIYCDGCGREITSAERASGDYSRHEEDGRLVITCADCSSAGR